MIKNYLKSALRNLHKNKVFALVNIIGLVIALTSCIYITLFVLDELNHDRFHENAAQIYRVRIEVDRFGFSPSTSWLLASKLQDEFPEIKAAARIQPMHEPVHFQSGEQLIKENNYFVADNAIFDIFTLPLKIGDSKHALNAPHSVVITQEIANKYFGDQNPLGQVLRANIHSKWYELQVTGVLENIPANSDFDVDFLLSWSVLYAMRDHPGRKTSDPHPMESWLTVSTYTFVLLEPACDLANLESKFEGFIQKYIPGFFVKGMKLEALKDIHLYQIASDGTLKPGSIVYIYLFSAIGALILLVAGINFVILSTAGASVRAKEIGMRKVIGARRADLIKQFLSEANLLAFLALPVALLAVELLLPWINTLLNKQLDADYFHLWQFVLAVLAITLVMGLFSGSYVAFYLSRLQPVSAMQKKSVTGGYRGGLRKMLIVTQVTIFTVLLVSSLVIYRQLRFVRETNLGFDKDQLIVIDMEQADFGKHFNAFRRDVSQNPGIVNISAGSTLPLTRTGIAFKETSFPDNPNEKILYHAGYVDYNFFKTLNAHILQGRVFSPEFSQDLTESVVLNSMAVQKFGLENPVGSLVEFPGGPKRVIGVVDDFVVSCYYETSPLVYYLKPGDPFINYIILRIQPENIQATLQFLESTWYKYTPNAVFGFQFVDEELNRQYAKDVQFRKIMTIFTGLAILIASLGLFGLSLFMIKSKTKELGVRKVLGASMRGLIFLQTKEIIYLVIIGSLVAWPAAYFMMNKWLQNFAYRIDMSWWMFVMAGAIALTIAVLTVSRQAICAAMGNPVEALRYE